MQDSLASMQQHLRYTVMRRSVLSLTLITIIFFVFLNFFAAQFIGSLISVKVYGFNVAHPKPGWAFAYISSGIFMLSVLSAWVLTRTKP